MRRSLSLLRTHALSLGIVLGVALAIALRIYPPGTLATHLHGADAYSGGYAVNWGQHVLWQNPWKYFAMPIFSTQESPRFFTETNLLLQLITVPLRLTGNPVLSFNLAMIATILLTALCAYIGAWLVLGHRLASTLTAIIFACNSDIQYHLWGHPNISMPFAVPLCLSLQWFLLRRSSTPTALLLGFLLFLQFLASFYLGVILTMGMGAAWICHLAIGRRFRISQADWQMTAVFVTVGLAAFVYSTPFRALGAAHGQRRGLSEAALYSADLPGYFLPCTMPGFPRTLPGKILEPHVLSSERLENAQFFGWFPWLLALGAFVYTIRLCWKGKHDGIHRHLCFLLPVLLVGFILSLGPWLWWGNHLTGIRLPFYYIFTLVPPLRFIRASARFAVLVSWFVAMASGFAILEILRRDTIPRCGRYTLVCIAAAIILLESYPITGPPLHPHDPEPRRFLASHPDIATVAPIPFNEPRFLMDSALSFPESPSGTFDGVYNPPYHGLVEKLHSLPLVEQAAVLRFLNVEAIMLYDPGILQELHAIPDARILAQSRSVALIDIRAVPAQDFTDEIASINALPRLPESDAFPIYTATLDAWIPAGWSWLNDEEPPAWVPFEWSKMADEGFVYHSLHRVFYDGLSPRPLADVGEIHLRISLRDPGVDYAVSRVYWLTDGDPGWLPEKSCEANIHADGRWQVVTFRLYEQPSWNATQTLTALQFEPTTTPHPGQRVLLSEIRLSPRHPENP